MFMGCKTALAQIAIDSTGVSGQSNNSTTVTSAAYGSGAHSNLLLLCWVGNERTSTQGSLATVTGMSDTTGQTLTWSKKWGKSDSKSTLNAYVDKELWYTYSSSAIASNATFTATLSVAPESSVIICQGYTGANSTYSFDPNSSLPASAIVAASGTPTVSGVSTSEAATLLIGSALSSQTAGCSTLTAGSGFSLVAQIHNQSGTTNNACMVAEYQIVSAAQSGISIGFTGSWADTITVGDAACAASNSSCGAVAAASYGALLGVGH